MAKPIMGRDFMQRWADALELPPSATRVVIDVHMNNVVRVYYSTNGTEDLLQIEPPSADEVQIFGPKMEQL